MLTPNGHFAQCVDSLRNILNLFVIFPISVTAVLSFSILRNVFSKAFFLKAIEHIEHL